MATSDAVKNLFPSLQAAQPSPVDSGVSTPQVAPAAPTAPAITYGQPSAVVPPASPPKFTSDVPTVMDATELAGATSEPTELPVIPETKAFKMADGRFYNPTTGVSGATEEEVLTVQASSATGGAGTGGAGAEAGTGAGAKTETTIVSDDVTETIKTLFPESDSLVSQYADLRKSSGLEADEAALAKVNQEAADMQAVIEGIEDEVRAQAGGMADESFIQATVADRIRRLMPQINRINARLTALTANVENKKATVTEQLGFSQQDIANARQQRTDLRQAINDQLSTFGSAAFSKLAPEVIAEIEKRAGLPAGFINAKAKTLDERAQEVDERPDALSITEKYGSGIIGEYNFYVEQEKAAGRTPLSFNAYADMDANRKRATTIAGGMSTQASSQFLNVTNKFQGDPVILKAVDASVVDGIMDSVIADPKNPTNQLNVLYGYVKALDPDSAVREGELNLAQTAQSYLAKFGSAMVRLAEGRVIDPKLASEMAKATKELARARQEAARKRESFYRSQASTLGFGNEFNQYLGDIELPYGPGEASGGDGAGGEFDW